MVDAGIEPSNFTYNAVINLYAGLSDVEQTLHWVMELKNHNYHPDAVTYAALIKVYSLHNNVEMMSRYLTEMREAGYKPNISTNKILKKHKLI